MSKSFDQTFDTNLVQSLYIIKYFPQKAAQLQKDLTTAEFIELSIRAKNLHTNTTMYITPQVMEEIKLCENKLPGIVDFARKYFHLKIVKSRKVAEDIAELMASYLIKEFPVSHTSTEKQSALTTEQKNGVENFADVQIVAENNVTYGNPFFTLNAKHMVSMPVPQNTTPNHPKNMPYTESPFNYNRSKAIIYENHKLLKSPRVLHKVTKANLKKPCATTYRVSDLNKKKYYLEAIVQDFDFF